MFRRTTATLAVVATAITFIMLVLIARHADIFVGRTVAESDVVVDEPVRNERLGDDSPLVRLEDGKIESIDLPPRTVALTFDDGPDPEWTPMVAEALDRHGVPGTFFVVGQEVVAHPELVEELHRHGHEIGNHTYTHPRMGTLSDAQIQRQISLTQRAVVGATGVAPTVYRPPYSGAPGFLPESELDAAQVATQDGLLLVLSSRSARDFDPEVTTEELLAESLPALGTSAIITLHDGGGDRTRTVEVLDQLIPALKDNGYQFVTASEIAGMSPGAAPSRSEHVLGTALVGGNAVIGWLTRALWIVGVLVVGLMAARTVVLLALAITNERRRRRRRVDQQVRSVERRHLRHPVTVVVPAYNERDVIANSVRSIQASLHPRVEIIVVDDGSTDGTAEVLDTDEFADVRVVRQTNGGKAKALDTGIREATHDIVVLIDGDTLLEPTTLTELIRPFADDRIGAVAGNAKVGNRSSLVAKIQHVEYTIASAIERRAFDQLGVMLCVPGAVGAFRRQAVIEVGGVSSDTLAEDTDLTLAVSRAGWRVAFAPTARAWTEVPSSMRGLFRQRLRWNYGILQAIAKHRGAVHQRGRSGRPGRVVLPYVIVMGYLATLAAPALDLLLLIQIVTGSLSWATVGLWCAGLVTTVLLGVVGLAYESEPKRFAALLPVQQLLYRQLLYLTVFKAITAAISGIRLPWNKLERTADVTVGADTTEAPLEEVVIDLRDPEPDATTVDATGTDGTGRRDGERVGASASGTRSAARTRIEEQV